MQLLMGSITMAFITFLALAGMTGSTIVNDDGSTPLDAAEFP